MNENALKRLLQDADGGIVLSAPEMGELSAAVRKKLRQRKQRMRAGAIALAVLLMIGLGSGLKYRSAKSQKQIAVRRQQIALEQMETAKSILRQAMNEEPAEFSEADENGFDDPVRRIEEQVDETAFVLMYQARRMAEVHQDKETALELYRQVTEHFGRTQWAKEAKEKIAELQPSQI